MAPLNYESFAKPITKMGLLRVILYNLNPTTPHKNTLKWGFHPSASYLILLFAIALGCCNLICNEFCKRLVVQTARLLRFASLLVAHVFVVRNVLVLVYGPARSVSDTTSESPTCFPFVRLYPKCVIGRHHITTCRHHVSSLQVKQKRTPQSKPSLTT
jgi:hypothetical protein